MAYNPGTDSYTEDTTPPAPGAGVDVNPNLDPGLPVPTDPNDPNARPLVLSPMQQDAVAAATQPPAVDPTTGAPLPAAPAPAAPAAPLTLTPAPRQRAPRSAGAPAAPAGPSEADQLTADTRAATQERIAAAQATGEAEAQAATDKADKYDQAAEQVRQQQDLRDQFEEAQKGARAKAQALADKAEKDVEGFQYHDYWSTHSTGERVRTAIAGFLMGFGGGVQGAQAFMQSLDAKMNRDMEQQKATLQKKITLAEAKRRGVKDFDEYVRDQRAALDYKAGQQRIALADEVDAMAARGGAKVDKAKAAEVSAQLRQDGNAQILAVRKAVEGSDLNRAHIKLMEAQASKERAEAGRARAQAKTLASGAKEEGKQIVEADKRAKDITNNQLVGTQKSPGPLVLHDRLSAMQDELTRAIQTGDRNAAVLALDEGSRLISGSAPTKTSTHLLQGLQSARDELESKWGQLSGNPGATAAFTGRLNQVVGSALEEKRQQIDQIRKRYLEGELSEGTGFAATPAVRQRVMGHARQMFSTVRNADGTPRYQEGGAQAGAPAAAPAIPPGAVMGTMNGKRGYALGGQFYPLGP